MVAHFAPIPADAPQDAPTVSYDNDAATAHATQPTPSTTAVDELDDAYLDAAVGNAIAHALHLEQLDREAESCPNRLMHDRCGGPLAVRARRRWLYEQRLRYPRRFY